MKEKSQRGDLSRRSLRRRCSSAKSLCQCAGDSGSRTARTELQAGMTGPGEPHCLPSLTGSPQQARIQLKGCCGSWRCCSWRLSGDRTLTTGSLLKESRAAHPHGCHGRALVPHSSTSSHVWEVALQWSLCIALPQGRLRRVSLTEQTTTPVTASSLRATLVLITSLLCY